VNENQGAYDQLCQTKLNYMTTTTWGFRSLSYWLVILTSLGIIFIGIRFLAIPGISAHGFGIDFATPADAAYGHIKGVRDLFSGVCLLILVALGGRKVVGYVYAAAIMIPFVDGLTVLQTNGIQDIAHLSIHWGTVLGMIIISLLVLLPTWKRSSAPSGNSSR
jgi:hypothetical protein